MRAEIEREPGGSPGLSLAGGNHGNQNPITKAAIDALIEDGKIILGCCHRVAAGHGLHWSEYDRLHDCFQTWFKVLEVASRE